MVVVALGKQMMCPSAASASVAVPLLGLVAVVVVARDAYLSSAADCNDLKLRPADLGAPVRVLSIACDSDDLHWTSHLESFVVADCEFVVVVSGASLTNEICRRAVQPPDTSQPVGNSKVVVDDFEAAPLLAGTNHVGRTNTLDYRPSVLN